ncbi:MAG: hypothetical protein AB1847_07090, partial [bacterium]
RRCSHEGGQNQIPVVKRHLARLPFDPIRTKRVSSSGSPITHRVGYHKKQKGGFGGTKGM